jgi:acetylornithine deacetylase/succinyl-diaminopimelate desuccinylase-like protein
MLVLKITIRLLVIYKELQKLGLQTYTRRLYLDRMGNLVKSRNILARIEGTSNNLKALLLLSHYDSAPHSYSNGASDAGSE